ncbi:MAG: acyl-CoA dehydrogenase [Alphaproteobacteria bacterium]
MYPYNAPVADMQFVLKHIAKIDEVCDLPKYEDASPDLIDAVLDEAAKFTGEVLAPLNHTGDIQGATYENGVVRVPDGFKEAYQQFVDAGWQGLPFDPDHGGQGLPWVLQTAISEMLNSSNLAFALSPLLTQGAIDALEEHGNEEQKATYLPNLLTGKWNGTMNLTEPQAGTDVGAARTRAVKADDGSYRIKGSKIFITWGENDCTENIIHLVLARVPDAPEGSKGISLFIVPKFMVNADGSLGERNDLRCSGIEHKLGIHGSPTCMMSFGDNEGAIGYLVGEENRGMQYMFTMMNNARLAVGVQGLAIAERAYQAAVSYAKERKQSSEIGSKDRTSVAIIKHPDVRRNLLLMKSQIEAMRGLAYYTLAQQDRQRATGNAESGQVVDLLVPVVKSWLTDKGVELASIGVQIHGGMGFIEETGAAQYYRDARILPIYEGTNGVQALDLMGRKTFKDQGAATRLMLDKMNNTHARLQAAGLSDTAASVKDATSSVETGLNAMLAFGASGEIKAAASAATAYQELLSICFGAWIMAERLLAAQGDAQFETSQAITTKFYMTQILPKSGSLLIAMNEGAIVNDMDEDAF